MLITTNQQQDKCRGALLGTMVGDTLGAPVEGWDGDGLENALYEYATLPQDSPRRARLQAYFGPLLGEASGTGGAAYTDDTQMMIGVAESLVDYPDFDGADMARRWADNFEVWRGYGPGAVWLLEELRGGAQWDTLGASLFGGAGSFGNGAAMRVAPVAVCHHRKGMARVRQVAQAQAQITHTHPLGWQGAVLQSVAVALALSLDPTEPFDPFAFVQAVWANAGELDAPYTNARAQIWSLLQDPLPRSEVAEILGCGIEAHLSVPVALYAFVANAVSLPAAITYAVRLGGDTDTIGAMCGAIAGAYHGATAIPAIWLNTLENAGKGRDYVVELAGRLLPG